MARKARSANGGGQIRRRRKVSNIGGNGKPLEDDELDELANHWQLLARLWQPVYENNEADLTSGDKRFVGQLIKEMGELIKQLKKQRVAAACAWS